MGDCEVLAVQSLGRIPQMGFAIRIGPQLQILPLNGSEAKIVISTHLLKLWNFEECHMETAVSKNGMSIRLPDERWLHLTESHSEMAGYYADVLETIEDPDTIYEGGSGELLASSELEIDKYLVSRQLCNV